MWVSSIHSLDDFRTASACAVIRGKFFTGVDVKAGGTSMIWYSTESTGIF